MHKSLYETHVMSDPLLPFIFHRSTRLTPTGRTVFSNWHTNLELLNCVEGEGTVLLDGKSVDFRPGDTVCVNTNVIHRIVTDSFVGYHCLIVENGFCRRTASTPRSCGLRSAFRAATSTRFSVSLSRSTYRTKA